MCDSELRAMHSATAAFRTHREEGLRSIRERRNASLSATRSLPPEILGNIFQFRSYDPMSGTSFLIQYWFYRAQNCHRWLTFTHVCRHWRAVALQRGSLWNRLHCAMPEAPWRTYLIRSANTLLTVHVDWASAGGRRRKDIMDHCGRIEELYLILPADGSDFDELDQMFLSPAPYLHTLHLKGGSGTWYHALKDFIVHRSPALRNLKLDDIYFPWGVDIANIECLRLSAFEGDELSEVPVHRNARALHTFDDVLHTLQSAPSLKTLDLLGSYVLIPAPQITSPIIHLPVNTLELSSFSKAPFPSSLVGILAAIIPTPVMDVNIAHNLEYLKVDASGVTALLAHIPDALRIHLSSRGKPGSPAVSTVLHLGVNTSWPNCHRLFFRLANKATASPLFDSYGTNISDGSPSVEVKYSGFPCCNVRSNSTERESLRSATLMLVRSLPDGHVDHLRHIALTGLCWTRTDVVSTFGQARGVEALTVYAVPNGFEEMTSVFVGDLLRVSASSPGIPAASGASCVIFPALRTLHLKWVDFGVRCDGGTTTLEEVFTLALESRKAMDCGLQSLDIEHCHLEDRFVELWCSIVPQVTVTAVSTS
ncbi:hypothetical protein PENSPDRAFT_445880 [Peniophora sp. CONT]|nr:hypothetical protein PENSPDRAFT_445880 [Peniophora sp. CONT]